MKKQDVKEIVIAKYPEIGEDKYVPKLPNISEAALAELEEMVNSVPLMRSKEIIAFIDNIKDERAKR